LRSRFLGRCAKIAINNADLIHSWGKNITKGLLKFNADPEKILTLHRGIDMKPFVDLKGNGTEGRRTENIEHRTSNVQHRMNKETINSEARGLSEAKARQGRPANSITDSLNNELTESPTFISTRSLAPEYEIDKIIQAFKIVLDKIPGAKFDIVGSGSEEEDLKRLVKDLALDEKVIFHGKVSKAAVIDLLKKSDIYVSIIQTEGISSSLIEAIACEVLPIVADMPASRNLLENNVNACLITQTKSEVLAEVMLRAVDSLTNWQSALKENKQNILKMYDREINQKVFVGKYKTLID